MLRRAGINVFVSHTDNDTVTRKGGRQVPLRQEVADLLEEDLLVCAIVVPEDPTLGKLTDKVLDNISDSDYFLLLLTDAAVRQPWVNFEIGAMYQSLAASRTSRTLTPLTYQDRRRDRFVVLVPDINRKRPDFSAVDVIRIPWQENGPVLPQATHSDPHSPRLRLTWRANSSPRNDYVRRQLGRKLLSDVFGAHLPNVIPASGEFRAEDYELWLNAFAAWSASRVFAVSRQPLMYWWGPDGLTYRERLARPRADSHPRKARGKTCISRLCIWGRPKDGYPVDHSNSVRDPVVVKGAGRAAGFRYCCREAKVFDMLMGFMRDCHEPITHACYAFVKPRERKLPNYELIRYDDDHVLIARGANTATVQSELRSANATQALADCDHAFEQARLGTYTVAPVQLAQGFSVSGAGTIAGLLRAVQAHHDAKCPKDRKIRVPPDVTKLWIAMQL